MTPDDEKFGPRADDWDIPPDTALWKKINDETELLRRRTTPMHVQQRILSSLPDPPQKSLSSASEIRLSPVLATALGVALLGLGLLLGMVLHTH